MTATVCRFDAARIGHRTRTPAELRSELVNGCRSLAALADAIEEVAPAHVDLDGASRTVEGIRRLLCELRAGGAPDAA